VPTRYKVIDKNDYLSFFFREMLKSVIGALVKMIKIVTLYWEIVKNEEFNFLKVKNC